MYQAALIGLGNIAWKLGRDPESNSSLCHKDALDQHPETSLVCGYSPDLDEVQLFTQKTGLAGYTDLDAMFRDEKLDLISVCSPNEHHAEHLRQCFNHDIPLIWLEKPAASSSKEIATLVSSNTESKKPATVLVNFQRRYTRSYQNLKTLINDRHFGKVLNVEIHYSRGLETNGSHMLDLLFYLFDQPDYKLEWVQKNEQSQNPDFVINMPDDTIVHFSGIDASYHNIDVAITCESGRLSILHGGMTLRVEEKQEHELFPGFYRLKDTSSDILGTAGFDRAFDIALSDLIESHDHHHEPKSNLSTALYGQKLLEEVLSRRHP